MRVWELPTARCVDWVEFPSPATSVAVSPTGEFLSTAHVGQVGLWVWANKTYFQDVFYDAEPRVPTPVFGPRPQVTSSRRASVSDEAEGKDQPAKRQKVAEQAEADDDEEASAGFGSDEGAEEKAWDAEEWVTTDHSSEELASTDDEEEGETLIEGESIAAAFNKYRQIPEPLPATSGVPAEKAVPTKLDTSEAVGIALSGGPISQWKNLTMLDIIAKRNKPKEPPKKPENAPFFLPTVAGLDPVFAAPSKESAGKESEGDEGEEGSGQSGSRVLKVSGRREATSTLAKVS